ncbi:MAG TPA: glycosyltransferase, partial [Longimicrobium sp.]|nr:glycosyltransferase [Longimicrobium sp.]
FRRYFDEVKPDVLEIYTSINWKVLLPMVLYAAARGVPRTLVSRGELYPADFNRNDALTRLSFIALLKLTNLVIAKELYVDEMLDRHCPDVARFRWTNAIPVRGEPSYERQGNEVLFLNFFKSFRNLEVIIRAAPLVRRAVPDVRFLLVGSSGQLGSASNFFAALNEYEAFLHGLIAELGVGDFVSILPFTTEPDEYYARAKVYLLPADLVYCNYALLEAMERGVPPVTSDEKDRAARLIVEDGVSGRLVPIDPQPLAAAVVELLQDEERRRAMGAAARRKVQAEFDLARQAAALAAAYRALAEGRTPAVDVPGTRAGPIDAYAGVPEEALRPSTGGWQNAGAPGRG